MTATPLQLANSMAYIANDGYFYTPHFVDSIENENEEDKNLLAEFRKKQVVTKIPKAYFDAIKEGMHDVTVYGTAAFIKIPGIEYCAKTGTAQNPHGKNHSIFVCFAPKDNPTIAVAVIVENAGYGSVWAGPIGGLVMEKYLNDTLTAESQLKADNLSKVDLMPQGIKEWYIRHNRTELMTPIEYNNDELGDVWEMEVVSTEKKDSVKQDTSKKTELPVPLPPKKLRKETILPKKGKKKAVK